MNKVQVLTNNSPFPALYKHTLYNETAHMKQFRACAKKLHFKGWKLHACVVNTVGGCFQGTKD